MRIPLFILTLAVIFASPVQAQKLTFGAQEFPPFNWVEQGKLTGGFKDVIEKICKKLQYECSIQLSTVARALIEVKEGQLDGVLALIPNPEREAYLYFSNPIVKAHTSYMAIHGKEHPIKNPKELSGWTILAVRSSSTGRFSKELAKQDPSIQIAEYVSYKSIVEELLKNPAQHQIVGVGAQDTLEFYAQNMGVVLDVVYSLPMDLYTLGLSKKTIDSKTLQAINQTIDQMTQSGELEKILAPYHLHIKPR